MSHHSRGSSSTPDQHDSSMARSCSQAAEGTQLDLEALGIFIFEASHVFTKDEGGRERGKRWWGKKGKERRRRRQNVKKKSCGLFKYLCLGGNTPSLTLKTDYSNKCIIHQLGGFGAESGHWQPFCDSGISAPCAPPHHSFRGELPSPPLGKAEVKCYEWQGELSLPKSISGSSFTGSCTPHPPIEAYLVGKGKF